MDKISSDIKIKIMNKIKGKHPNLNITEDCIESLLEILKFL